jgi:DNA-binding MarR family transcriptional regulator
MKKVKPEEIAPQTETLAVADRLHSAALHLLRRVRKQDAVSRVGPAQLSALSVLVFGGPKTLGDLAALEQVKPPTMSRVVSGLRRSLLVEITRDPLDARRVHIRASASGARLVQQGRERRIDYLADHLGSLTASELAQLSAAARLLEKLLRDWRDSRPQDLATPSHA